MQILCYKKGTQGKLNWNIVTVSHLYNVYNHSKEEVGTIILRSSHNEFNFNIKDKVNYAVSEKENGVRVRQC